MTPIDPAGPEPISVVQHPTSHPTVDEAAAIIRRGGAVAFPTETVYGLGADALNADAVRRVFLLKGRPGVNPLIVHVSGAGMAARVVAPGGWSDDAARLARAMWPGPLSMVLPRADAVPPEVTAGGPTVAVRCPDHPVALALLFHLGTPLVGPSANLSGSVSPTTAAHVRDSFPPDDVFVLDGGPCRGGIESTVLDLASPTPRVLRPGLIGASEIAEALGRDVLPPPARPPARPGDGPGAPLPSPGLTPRHYAPRTPARLFDSGELDLVLRGAGRGAVVLSHDDADVPPPHALIRLPADADLYARELYAALRDADGRGAGVILIQRPPRGGDRAEVWAAIADRLARATA